MSVEPSAVFAAIRQGDFSAVETYFRYHPAHLELRGPSESELTPIHAAAHHGQLEIVRLLVDLGATVYSHPLATYPPVVVADWAAHQHVVDYFLCEIPDKAEGTLGIGVTCNLAGRQGWIEQVRAHIKRDHLAVHQRGWIGDTPLHWPSHNGHIEIVRLLLAAGADPDAEENNWIGGTPLHWASERHADIIRLLVSYGANPNSVVTRPGSEHLGGTPLHWCARQRDDCAAAAEALLEAGTDPRTLDAFGKTAADWAFELENRNVMSVLADR